MATGKRKRLAAGFFWIGAAMTAACIAVVWMGHASLMPRIEGEESPLLWAFGGVAAVAFLATEVCDSVSSASRKQKEEARRQTAPSKRVV